jgi:hypothetical protein
MNRHWEEGHGSDHMALEKLFSNLFFLIHPPPHTPGHSTLRARERQRL